MLNHDQVQLVKSVLDDIVGGSSPQEILSFRQPRDVKEGDVAIPCFPFAKLSGKSPDDVACELAAALVHSGRFERVHAANGYVNITLFAEELFSDAFAPVEFRLQAANGRENIMVEYLSPNTNKPLHMGHLRNGALGAALANVLEAVGHTVIRAILVNDRGVHICKSMLAWERFMSHLNPNNTGTKPDHFVGECYVRYNVEVEKDPSLKDDADRMLQLWESGDERVLDVWRTMNAWVYEGFLKTFQDFGFTFGTWYYESNTYTLGKSIVTDGLKKGIFKKNDDGAVVFPLGQETFGVQPDGSPAMATVLSSDGTSVYMTQDLGTAVVKAREYELDRSIFVVASEQDRHFKVLFEILSQLGYPWASQCFHLSYEMVELPAGRMKSREGTVVDADTLLEEVIQLARAELVSRRGSASFSSEELDNRAQTIALAAIKFYLLHYKPQRKVKFDPQQSVSLVGDTGPYCLYAYARARSILNREMPSSGTDVLGMLGTVEERDVATRLLALKDSVVRAAERYDTSLLTREVLELAKSFNRFYANCPVLQESDSDLRGARLLLTDAVSRSLAKSLDLLGIEVLEEM